MPIRLCEQLLSKDDSGVSILGGGGSASSSESTGNACGGLTVVMAVTVSKLDR